MSSEEPARQAHHFEFNLTEDEYRLIERAAEAWHCSIRDFLLDAALEKAISVTEEDVSYHLATVTSDEFTPPLELEPGLPPQDAVTVNKSSIA